jgi:hypothetical protein
MKDLWTFDDFQVEGIPSELNLTGWDVEAQDGHIGKVDEATYEVGRSYVVVDTGFWIFGKKRMIPAGSILRIDPGHQMVYVGLTKDQIKQAPDFDQLGFEDDEFRQRHSDYYGQWRQHDDSSSVGRDRV